jgi:YD repeat-containing protein
MGYDHAGRVVKVFNADGDDALSTYDALGNLISVVDYAGTENDLYI